MGFEGEINPGTAKALVPDQYIVITKPYLTQEQFEEHRDKIKDLCNQAVTASDDSFGAPSSFHDEFAIGTLQDVSAASESGQPSDPLDEAVRGYYGVFTSDVLKAIKSSNEVAHIEHDQYMYPLVTQELPIVTLPDGGRANLWGLSRISHHDRYKYPTNNQYVYEDSESGRGTTAYVIDTGVRKDHEEFEGRAKWGTATVPGASQNDTSGHGTHVAGTVAGKTYGVAKNAEIIDVKVYPDDSRSTTTSAIMKGLEWAVDHALGRDISKSVANISSGGGRSDAFNQAIAAAVRRGMVVVVAAGNESADAMDTSPASAPAAITVGATDTFDRITGFSNWGRILDLLAPGQDIVSAWHTSRDAIRKLNGTSMASPHVAGLACCLRQNNSYRTPIAIARELRARAEGGISIHPSSSIGTPNSFVHNGAKPEQL